MGYRGALMLRLIETFRRLGGYKFPRLGRSAFNACFALLPREGVVEICRGIRTSVDFSDTIVQGTYWGGSRFEAPTGPWLEERARESGATHFFDLGSNFGYFTWHLLSQFPELIGHAFEPNPALFAKLQDTRQRNALTRFHPWNLGLSDAPGRLELRHTGDDNSGSATFGPAEGSNSRVLAEVPVVTFDAWREEQKIELPSRPLWLAKIDVEGFEARLLRGMTETLRARPFAGLAIEQHEENLVRCGSSVAEVESLLASAGYRQAQTAFPNAYYVPA